MIECSTAFPPAASFFLRCGSIAANAAVVWEKSGRYGVNFHLPLSKAELTEQLSRNDAINSRKQLKSRSDSPGDRSPTATTVHQIRNTAGNAPLAAHFSAVEGCHQQVESSLFVLKTMIAGELSDIGELSAARLRLRQGERGQNTSRLRGV